MVAVPDTFGTVSTFVFGLYCKSLSEETATPARPFCGENKIKCPALVAADIV